MEDHQTNDYEWHDECFRVYETNYGLWHSVSKEGKQLITALTETQCIHATRFYLKGSQDGWPEPEVIHEGVVGGKL